MSAAYTPIVPQYDSFKPPRLGDRDVTRTPSPTPSEQQALADDGKPHPSNWFKRKNWPALAITLVIVTISILLIVFQKKIIVALEPACRWMKITPGGWAIPIAILIVLSIPPLFGQGIVLLICGLVWGPGIGMAIAAAGTIIGELGTFYLFKFLLRQRGSRYEEKNIRYAVLARVIRDGGLKVAIIARWSIIPPHMLTALFSTCGMTLPTFLIASVSSLPNQFVSVYLGYAARLAAEGSTSRTPSIVDDINIVVSIVVTILAGRYMRHLQNDTKPLVIRERQKRRQHSFAPRLYSTSGLEEGERVPLNLSTAGRDSPALLAPKPGFAASAPYSDPYKQSRSPAVVSHIRVPSPTMQDASWSSEALSRSPQPPSSGRAETFPPPCL